MAVGVDRFTDVRRVLAGARCVLFDFDGPICRLFPEGRSQPVADDLRREIQAFGASHLLSAAERTHKDPHVVLRAVHRALRAGSPGLGGLLRLLEERVTAGELAAAELVAAHHEWHTPDADALLRKLDSRGVALAVVTNNSALAAEAYLERRGLLSYFTTVQGRRADDPGLMKPHPDVLFRALRVLGLGPDDAVMIGDTATDVQAAARAGVGFVGYGRNERKIRALCQAEAAAVITSYGPLVEGEWGHGP
ncbi:HAD-IA family hydrolase [Streptomyces sp. Go-475]|uniref:HAD-IA family hydrolase n=1 Tax=Streptomyces sp. Go-475 TaxID=2072505 RepID=UPI000DEF7E62|nr:HAD-IA family hydrolase [Streptomyces sp. Go-475]AXE86872.1 Phosphoglycolate phosphatase [Streptomyces sp. Go-475]